MRNYKVLVVDTDPEFLSCMEKVIVQMGHAATCSRTLAEGLEAAARVMPDLITVNAEMPDGRGVEFLRSMLEAPSSPEVIVVSDSGDPDEAELAIKGGAWDYIEKPVTLKGMALSLVRALEYRAKNAPVRRSMNLKEETLQEIAGNGAKIRACLDLVDLAASSDASVLICGETGTGKELFAWAIHNNSSRAKRQFVVVDCASLPPTLVESTLFGYAKGAFTGADRPHKGLIKRADGGTLFLDEIGELPMVVQKSFLRVLQERQFRPVGDSEEVRSDFRLIAATNRDLDEMVERRQFRKDLLYRLRAFSMELPSLRERPEDIRDIVIHHMSKLCRSYGTEEKGFSPDFFDVLVRYEWPGNVRELVNATERAISAARDEPVLFPKHLPTYIRVQLARASVSEDEIDKGPAGGAGASTSAMLPKLVEAREAAIAHAERNYLKTLLASTRGDTRRAIGLSGLSRSRFYALLKKHRISISDVATWD